MPVVGSTVGGKYRIDRAIGAGGMGTVVSATHIELGTPVALKFLNEKVRDSASSMQRFTREARASAQLRSEHVCRVSDFGVEDGVPYIAMELLDGIDLAQLLDAGPVGAVVAVDYVLQACIGLAEAHGLGIVHRDLKPSNLFLSKRADGSPIVKVLDFGVAKIPVDGDQALTQTSTVIGSPGYMAPEQLRSSKTVDARADVWALGVILYELISSRHPFHASAVTEVAVKIAMDEPTPLPEAPPALREVVMRCLAKEPRERYADVGALAAALAPLAPNGQTAASVAHRFLMDGVDNRRTTPHSIPPATQGTKVERAESPTVRELPVRSLTPQQRGPEPVRTPSRGRAAIVIGVVAVLAAGGVVMWLVLAGQGKDPIAAIDPNDPPAVFPAPPPAPVADAKVETRGILDITVKGVNVATIVVDGVEWGVGQRISREVIGGPHEITIRAAGKDPVRRSVDGPGSITIDFTAAGKPPASDPVSAVRPLEEVGEAAAAISMTLKQASSMMQAKGLLTEDVLNVVKLRDQIRAATKQGDIGRAKRLAEQLLAKIEAVKVDRSFVTAKMARLNERIKLRKPSAALEKQFDELMADVVKQVNNGAFVGANVTLSVIAGLIASSFNGDPPQPKGVSPRSGASPSKF